MRRERGETDTPSNNGGVMSYATVLDLWYDEKRYDIEHEIARVNAASFEIDAKQLLPAMTERPEDSIALRKIGKKIQLLRALKTSLTLHTSTSITPLENTRQAIKFGAISLTIDLNQQYRERVLGFPDTRYRAAAIAYNKYANFEIMEAVIKKEGISLQDFADPQIGQKRDLGSLYSFLVEMTKFPTIPDLEETFAENQDYPLNHHPNMTKDQIIRAYASAYLLAAADQSNIKRYLLGKPRVVQEAGQRAEQIITNIRDVQARCLEALHSPTTSLDFPWIRDELKRKLNKDIPYGSLFFIAGLIKQDQVINLYRRSREFEAQDIEREFYEQIIQAVDEYVETDPALSEVATESDVDLFFPETIPAVDEPTIEHLTQLVTDITSRTGQKEISFDPHRLTWTGVKMPKRTLVRFDKQKTKKFTVTFTYEIEGEDEKNFMLIFDLTSQERNFDWLGMPDPDAMPERKAVLLKTIESLLEGISFDVEKEYQERHENRYRLQPLSPVTKIKGPYVPQEKPGKNENGFRNAPIPNEPVLSPQPEKRIRSFIDISDNDAFLSHIKRFLPKHQALIIKKIETFNKSGGQAGKFKELDKRQYHDDTNRFSLRAGNFRIILTQVSGPNGIQRLEIEEIENRRIVYR